MGARDQAMVSNFYFRTDYCFIVFGIGWPSQPLGRQPATRNGSQ
jgi:hypothetical protein